MSRISMNSAVAFFQLEAEYGVSPGAFSATDAMKIKSMTVNPLTGNPVERPFVKPYFGANESQLAAKRSTMQFTVEAVSAGSVAVIAGTAPIVGRLLRAAGHDEVLRAAAATIAASPPTGTGGPVGTFTYAADDPYSGIVDRLVTLECTTGGASGVAEFTVSAPAVAHLPAYEATAQAMTDATSFPLLGGASITPTVGTAFEVGDTYTIQLRAAGAFYTPISEDFESAHAFFQYGPNRHLVPGCRGNMTMNIAADSYFDLQFDFMGIPAGRTAELTPAVDFSGWRHPLMINNDNTPYVALGGREIIFRSIQPNVGQNLVMTSLVGQHEAEITNRTGSATLVFRAESFEDVDYFDNVADGTVLPFDFIHGSVQGDVTHLSMPRLQIRDMTYQDEEGKAMFSCTVAPIPTDAGNDEYTLAFK